MIVNTGLNQAAQLLHDDMTHVAIGTGTTAPTLTDTALETETDRNAITKKTLSGRQWAFRTLFLATELPTQIEEVGVQDAASSGIMFTRTAFQYAKAPSRDLLLVHRFEVKEGS